MKNIRVFYLKKKYSFLEAKFSIYLNRRVVVMEYMLFNIFKIVIRKYAYSNILKILPPKNENYLIKNSDIFHISDENIDCGCSLEPPRRGGSNEYPQSMYLS